MTTSEGPGLIFELRGVDTPLRVGAGVALRRHARVHPGPDAGGGPRAHDQPYRVPQLLVQVAPEEPAHRRHLPDVVAVRACNTQHNTASLGGLSKSGRGN